MTREEALNKTIGILTYHQVNFCKSKEAFANMNEIIEALEKIEQEPCENVPDINDGNIYECSCGYGWDQSKVVRHHFCPNCGRAVDNLIKTELNRVKTKLEPCEDCVSRQAVLDAIDAKAWEFCDYLIREGRNDEQKPVSHFADNLRECVGEGLPSVTPQQKMARWIDIMVGDMPVQACDQCNTFYPLAYTGGGHKYCPNCGAKMQEVEE